MRQFQTKFQQRAIAVFAALLVLTYSTPVFATEGTPSAGDGITDTPPATSEQGDFPVYSEGGSVASVPPASTPSSSDPFDDPFNTGSGSESSGGSSSGQGGESSSGEGGESGGSSSGQGGESSSGQDGESSSGEGGESSEGSSGEGGESGDSSEWESGSSGENSESGNEWQGGEGSGGNGGNNQPSSPNITQAPDVIVSAPEDTQGPTEFSPGDLDPLLSSAPETSTEESSPTVSIESTPDVGGIFSSPSQNSSNGGLSTLFFVGIGCILLALAGIAFVIYRQFFQLAPGSRKKPQPQMTAASSTSRGAADLLGVDDPDADDDVYHDGYRYYDDPNNDPYSDYYDDMSYGTEEARREVSRRAAEEETYTDISSSGSAGIPDSEEGADIYSNSAKKPVKRNDSDDFDWDSFFEQNGRTK